MAIVTPTSTSASVTIAAPPEIVFAIVSDARQHARIDGSGTVRAPSADAPERLLMGSTFSMGMKLGAPYTMRNRVVEFEQDRLIAWRTIGAHRWRYALSPVTVADTPGTEVTETWDLAAYPSLARRALQAISGRRTARALDATVLKLKAAAEADAAR